MMNVLWDVPSAEKARRRPNFLLKCMLHHSVVVAAVMMTLIMYLFSILYIQQLKTQWYALQKSHQQATQALHAKQVAYDELQSEDSLQQIADKTGLREPTERQIKYLNQEGALLVQG